MIKQKLEIGNWLDKYFYKDKEHSYYTWTYTDDGMHINDKSRWKDDDLLNEYERYLSNDTLNDVGLDKYDE